MNSLKYNVGLDIGVTSIGWAVLDENGKLLKIKGKNAYGVRLFSEGLAAADRRGFRTTRRRLKRRKWRLRFLDQIFEPYILAIDPNFFARKKESNLVPQDPNRHFYGQFLFDNQADQTFYSKYPTIYHLRQALMSADYQFDIREIYLAIHHIVKYRGHFLIGGSADSYANHQMELSESLLKLNQLFAIAVPGFQFDLSVCKDVEKLLLDTTMTRMDRQKTGLKLLYHSSDKIFKGIATESLKAMLGMKTNFSKILNLTVSNENDWKFAFGDETIDDELEMISTGCSEEQQDIIRQLQQIYAGLTLAEIVPNGLTLSESMIDKYDQHKKHRKMLQLIWQQVERPIRLLLKTAYADYINGKQHKAVSQDEFYTELTKIFKKIKIEIPEVVEIQKLMALGQFMPKQRTKANGVIPHQLQQIELDKIIENQKEYYPWLAELNPNEQRRNIAKYKLDELVAFRINYYIGPLITAVDQQKTSNAKFAWASRKAAGAITPWNLLEKIDHVKTAETFIKRMTTKDTYLLAEDVLPKHSLLYQKYEVLNELNKIKINGSHLENDLKQAIYHDLFEKNGHVTLKNLKDYLIGEGHYAEPVAISGLADETHFLSGLTTLKELRDLFGNQATQEQYQNDFEKMIEWATVFEDKGILLIKLDEISWLTDEQKKRFANKRYRGWGSLSKKLLTGLFDRQHLTIMDHLWQTTNNLMQIINQPVYGEAIIDANQDLLAERDSNLVINDLYTSPQNKKALRQIMLIMADLEKAFGQAPEKIAIEFARDDNAPAKRSIQRINQLKAIYKQISDEILATPEVRTELNQIKNNDLNDRLFLYFMQGGFDLYTGKKINIDQLSRYDIDHILPQALIKDNALDNRVLVDATINRNKSDDLPLDAFTGYTFANVFPLWERLHEQGLITNQKFNNLTLTPERFTKWTMTGFVKRQLVETRQIIKLAANLLLDRYHQENTKILTIKATMTHQLREDLDFPKNRDVNNYHHAFDAYLAIFFSIYLNKRYPKLRSFFTYGEFKRIDLSKMKRANFVRPLVKKKEIIDEETGEVLWNRTKDEKEMNRVYNFKKILITREVTENHGAMFGQTLFSAREDQTRQLIPKKKGLPTKWYGGYSKSNVSFMSVVRIKKAKVTNYLIVGIPTRKVESLLDERHQLDNLKLESYLTDYFTTTKINKKTGVLEKTTKPFELVIPKVRLHQLFNDDGKWFTLGSATYYHNAQELFLSKSALKTLANRKNTTQANLVVFDEIMTKVNQYFPLYDMNKFREKLNQGREKFAELSETGQPGDTIPNQLEVLKRMLIGLHANAATADLKVLGIKSNLGVFHQKPHIILSEHAKIIYQSPTGLYQRIVALKDL